MFFETWVFTIMPGKTADAVGLCKRAAENGKNTGMVNSFAIRPATGNMNKVIIMNQFKSAEDRTEWYHSGKMNSEEGVAIMKEIRETACFDETKTEHHYFFEPN